MTKLLIGTLLVLFAFNAQSENKRGKGLDDEWSKNPVLKAIELSLNSTIQTYRTSIADIDEEAQEVINSLAEVNFIVGLNALREHSNPKLLESCLKFCTFDVPEKFNRTWSLVFLEMADIDRDIAAKVAKSAKSKGMRNLTSRSMKPDEIPFPLRSKLRQSKLKK